MTPEIVNLREIELSPIIEQILHKMFTEHRQVFVRQEFLSGLSGGRVIDVCPIKANGTPELPAVIKVAPLSLIEKEWQAYRQHIHRRLPYIAEIRDEPVLIPETGWGGLRYTLMGGGTFEVISLREFCRRPDISANEVKLALERLLKIMRHIWDYNDTQPDFSLATSYDHLLPVHLLVQDFFTASKSPYRLTADHLPSKPLQVGDPVCVSGFAVCKVNPVTQTVTLRQPRTLSHYLRCKSTAFDQVITYPVGHIIDSFVGEIIETRGSRLQAEVRRAFGDSLDPSSPTIPLLPDEADLPNPLLALDTILNTVSSVKTASIHGDFNLENILIEPETRMVSLIDFADARHDHILHDFFRLETEVITRLLPEIFQRHHLSPAPTLVSLYQQLHWAAFHDQPDRFVLPHPDFKKPLAMLGTLRQAARQYLQDKDDPAEYYQGLALYLLGALKFKNLNLLPEQPLPKQLAFWGATAAHYFLTNPTSLSITAGFVEPVGSSGPSTISGGPSHLYEETARPRPAAPFQVMQDIPQFVGRRQELNHLADLLTRNDGPKLACLTGMGGIGKTALATRLAHLLRPAFPDGVLWANVAASEPLAIIDSWVKAYGYDFSSLPDLSSRAGALRSLLADKNVLMIFDDVWSADSIRALLPSGSQSKGLLTTRDSEIAAALDGYQVEVTLLSATESQQLLSDVVGADRVEAEATVAAEICDLLGHLPLAVKIAARRLVSRRRWRLADLAERLRDEKKRLAELRLGDREVRASFAVSWAALNRPLRRTFALLGVFQGRLFTASALAAVTEEGYRTAEDDLASLVALSLVAEEGEFHYQQHPLLADFAREYLGEHRAAYERMARYYLSYAAKCQGDYLKLEPEWDNLLAGMRIAHRQKMWPVLIDYGKILADAWFARTRFSDMREGYRWVCEAAEALEDRTAWATALCHRGQACIEQGDYAEATRYMNRCLRLCQELNDLNGLAKAKFNLGRIAKEMADFDEAQQLFKESRQLRKKLGDLPGVAETLYLQADIPYFKGDYREAHRLGREALDMLQRSPGNELGYIRTLGLLADVAIKQEAYSLSEQYCERALELCDKIQEQGELAIILYILAEVYRCQGKADSARGFAERSLHLLRRMGDRKMEAWALWRLSKIDADLQDYPRALEEGLQSLKLQRELENSWNEVSVLHHLGEIYGAMNQPDQARRVWTEALDLAEALRHPLVERLREYVAVAV